MNRDTEPARFVNYYECPACGAMWANEWSNQCDDDCAACGHRHVSPYESDDIPEEDQ